MKPWASRVDRCASCGLARLYVYDPSGGYRLAYDYAAAPGYVRKGRGRVSKVEDRMRYVQLGLGRRVADATTIAQARCHGASHQWRFGPLVRGVTLEWELRRGSRSAEQGGAA